MQLAICDEVIGREGELRALAAAVAGVAEGRGAAAWIEGAAGTGKSTLIDAALGQATSCGCTVLRAAGDELTATFPLRVMADCLDVSRRSADPGRARVAAVLGGGAGGADEAARGMAEIVRGMCRQGPVVLAGDDLHWADEASLTLWLRLIEMTAEVPLLLAGTASRAPARTALAAVPDAVRRRGGLAVALGPLDPGAAGRVAARHLGADPGPRLQAELRRAGGNPLYVQQLAAALADAGLVDVADGIAEFDGEPGAMPAPLAASIGRRLGSLGDPARATARVAALLGDGCAAADVSAVAGRPPEVIAAALAEAAAAEVLTADDGRVRFPHELLRQALASQIPSAVSPALHRHAARVLAASGACGTSGTSGSIGTVARHLLAGPQVMDDWALRWLAARSEAALYEVPHAAAELLSKAVESVEEEDPRWEAFAGKLAQTSFWLGRDDGVGPLALEVARRTTDIELASRMRIYVMRSAARMGRYGDGIAAGESALRDPGLPGAWRARLGAWLAVVLLLSGRPLRGRAQASQALRDARRAGDALATACAHHAAALGSGTAAAVAHADRALAALGTDAESADFRPLLLRNRLLWLGRLDRADELERTLAVALREVQRSGTFGSVGILGAAAHVRYRQGRWDAALSYLAQIDPGFRDHDQAVRLRALASLIALHRGEQAEAAAHLRAAGSAAQRPPDSTEPAGSHFMTARALAAEADGDLRQAVRAVTAWLEAPGTLRRQMACDDAPDLVRLALSAGEPGIAGAMVASLEEDAAADPVPGRMLAARCGRAQIDDDPAALMAVAEDYRRRRWPVRRGMALEEAAVRLAQAGQHAPASNALAEAARAYAGPGAARDILRADARLRQHGIRRGPRSSHRRQSTGWAALTPAEARVARLAADGLSNSGIATRLFVSQRTVQAHVSRALDKLGVRSRAQLASALAAGTATGRER